MCSGRTRPTTPLDWSLKNLESDIRELLADEPRRHSLAEAGRNAYMGMVSTEGMEAFCNRFAEILETSGDPVC